MKIKVLILFFLAFNLSVGQAYVPICNEILKSRSLSIYEDVKRVVNRHTQAQDLLPNERERLQNLLVRLETRVNQFDQAYNSILAPYGTEFLPRLRSKLEEISADFRKKNWVIINELKRYLNSEGIRYRELNINRAADSLRDSVANRFISKSDQVYFGIDFFVNTIEVRTITEFAGFVSRSIVNKEVGYQIDTSKVSQDLGDEVRVFDEGIENDIYPGTTIPSIKSLEEDGNPFPGFPLTIEFLNFLKENGDEEGYINVIAKPILDSSPTFLNTMGLSNSSNHQAIDAIRRFDEQSLIYRPVIYEGMPSALLYDIAGYSLEQNGVLIIPGVRVSKEPVRNRFGVQNGFQLVQYEGGDLAAYPNPFEFFIGLISFAHIGNEQTGRRVFED